MTYRYPSAQQRDYILKKLVDFALDHEITADQLARNLDAATVQVPRISHHEESVSLAEEMARIQ